MRYNITQEVLLIANKLDGLFASEINGLVQTRYEYCGIKVPKFVKHMKIWGDAGVVKIKTRTSPKFKDKGVTCLFAGYDEDHDGECYRMLDPIRHYVCVTRGLVWLKRMCLTQHNATEHSVVPFIAAGESVESNDKAATNTNNNEVENSNEKQSKMQN